MKKYKIKIGKILLENNKFVIISEDNTEFISEIIKGSVKFKVFNESNQEVNISNLDQGDIIKIYTSNNQKTTDLDTKNISKNNIINKILIKNKYLFNSDSSEELEDYE
jgi:hypothetical protein